LINIISSSYISSLSHFEKLYGYAPDYSFFRVFCFTCFVLRPHLERSKLSSPSAICVFLGYGEGKMGYRYFDSITRKLYMSRHVVFEHIPFFYIPPTTHSLTRSDLFRIDLFKNDSDSLSSQVPSTSNIPPHVHPIRTNHSTGTDVLLSNTPEAPFSSTVPPASSEIIDLPNFAYSYYSSSFISILAYIHCLSEPFSYKEVIFYPLWEQAMDEELSALHKTDNWDLVPLPPSKSVIGCYWVNKIKTNFDGSIERYKVRLVVK